MIKLSGKKLLLIIILSTGCVTIGATEVYQSPEAFLAEVFENQVPDPEKVWIRKSMQASIREIMGHDLNVLRLRYWHALGRTAWILEEIGKERPITTGIVVRGEEIESVKILIFRESRGWEVKYPFFTDQFKQAKLISDYQLDKTIDGISGATLSVSAVTRLSRLALYLTDHLLAQGKI